MRTFVTILAVIILAGIGLFVFAYVNAGGIVASLIESYGSRAAGTDVEAGGVDIEFVQGTASVNAFTIDNPPGYSGGHLFSLDEIRVTLNLDETSGDLIVLREVIVDNPQVLYEIAESGANLDVIRNNIQAYQRSLGGGGGSGGDGDTRIIIDTLRFTGGTVVATAAGEVVNVDLPPLTLNDVGRASGGETAGQIAVQVGDRFTRHVSETVARSEVERRLGLDEGVVDRVRDLFGQ